MLRLQPKQSASLAQTCWGLRLDEWKLRRFCILNFLSVASVCLCEARRFTPAVKQRNRELVRRFAIFKVKVVVVGGFKVSADSKDSYQPATLPTTENICFLTCEHCKCDLEKPGSWQMRRAAVPLKLTGAPSVLSSCRKRMATELTCQRTAICKPWVRADF